MNRPNQPQISQEIPTNHTNCIIVLITSLIYIIYLINRSYDAITSNTWTRFKCNPIHLIVDEIFGKGSENTFGKCLAYYANSSLTDKIKEMNEKYEDKINYSINNINNRVNYELLKSKDEAIKSKQLSDKAEQLQDNTLKIVNNSKSETNEFNNNIKNLQNYIADLKINVLGNNLLEFKETSDEDE